MPSALDMRPQNLDEMIGQDTLKQKARIAIGASLARGEPLPHVLLTSNGGGLGKTSFAQILANEMYSPLISTTGQCLVAATDLRKFLIRMEPNTVLLVDEFHGIGYQAAEELLLVLEQGILNVNIGSPVSMRVPPFTLVAASTKPSSISDPLRQRFGLQFCFTHYSVAELIEIVSRATSRLGVEFNESVCRGIAQRSHGVPRKALRLVERVRDVVQARGRSQASEDDLHLAMDLEGIDHWGLGRDERLLLKILAQAEPRPVSARSLALALGIELSTVKDVLEPLLIRLGLVMIAGGRRITEQGLAHVRSLERLSA